MVCFFPLFYLPKLFEDGLIEWNIHPAVQKHILPRYSLSAKESKPIKTNQQINVKSNTEIQVYTKLNCFKSEQIVSST
jgi:hypothetical protein